MVSCVHNYKTQRDGCNLTSHCLSSSVHYRLLRLSRVWRRFFLNIEPTYTSPYYSCFVSEKVTVHVAIVLHLELFSPHTGFYIMPDPTLSFHFTGEQQRQFVLTEQAWAQNLYFINGLYSWSLNHFFCAGELENNLRVARLCYKVRKPSLTLIHMHLMAF